MTRPDRDRLAALVHEVRSPVAALAAIAATYQHGGVEASASRPLLALAIGACRGIERLVLDAALASLRAEKVDLGQLISDAVAVARLGGGNVRAEVDLSIPLLHADPIRLRQALDNLVSNALRHAGSFKEVLIHARRSETAILLSVTDQGPGIPLGEQGRIFELGVRLNSELPGSGLGLAVARAIAEAHGGTLTVESVEGEGATFTITLPRS